MNEHIQSARRIVLKIGSVLLVDESGQLRREWLQVLANECAKRSAGKDLIIVTSGAIALGRKHLRISNDISPANIALSLKQAAAAAGQVELVAAYKAAFTDIALILLTPRDTEARTAHLNARATINALLKHHIVPVINENDSVSTAEIRFGDNDRLAARVAQMCDADLLIQLSTTDGLYTDDPSANPEARHIPHVSALDDNILKMAKTAQAGYSVGGMQSKLEAARIAMQAGVKMIICKSLDGRYTLFDGGTGQDNARKRWIASHVQTKGGIVIDSGAVSAILSGKSLLPAGALTVEGDFRRGDPIAVQDRNGARVATGLSEYDASDARKLIGMQSEEIQTRLGFAYRNVLIHRSDMSVVK